MKLTSAQLFHGAALTAAAGVAGLVLAACGSTSGSSGSQHMGAGMGSSPSVSVKGSEMGGGSVPSASGMNQKMGSNAPTPGVTGGLASGAHNSADVAFLVQMIPHHTQAVAMADLAATRATSTQVKTLAAQIAAAQGPEITEMSGWLRGWAAPVPSGDMSGTAMTGMMSAADMANLAKLSGCTFDRTWLTMMTTHHEGALTMARMELRSGSNANAKTSPGRSSPARPRRSLR